jgi:chemotaxis protein methyltransferase CheR
MVKARGFDSFGAYIRYVESDRTHQALGELVNRISTNHTFFFREKAHFDYLRQQVLPRLIPELEKSGKRSLRIWCAGCATGEEAYTLMMILMTYLGEDYAHWDAGLLATDISERALARARQGLYAPERIEEVPPMLRNRFLRKTGPEQWRVSDELKNEITFRRFNLMNEKFPFKDAFHIIFCRNVMIYFDMPTRDALAQRFYQFTKPGGYLFIGHSETLGRDRTAYKYVQPAVYRRES